MKANLKDFLETLVQQFYARKGVPYSQLGETANYLSIWTFHSLYVLYLILVKVANKCKTIFSQSCVITVSFG